MQIKSFYDYVGLEVSFFYTRRYAPVISMKPRFVLTTFEEILLYKINSLTFFKNLSSYRKFSLSDFFHNTAGYKNHICGLQKSTFFTIRTLDIVYHILCKNC